MNRLAPRGKTLLSVDLRLFKMRREPILYM